MNYIPTLRVIAARSTIDGVIHKRIDKQIASLAICDEEFTYLANHISPYFLGFRRSLMSECGMIIGSHDRWLYILDFKVGNEPRLIFLPLTIKEIYTYERNIIVITIDSSIYYVGETDKEPKFIEVDDIYNIRTDLTIFTPNIIVIPSSDTIIEKNNTLSYINVEGCYFQSTLTSVKVGVSSDSYVTMEDKFADTRDIEFRNGKLHFSSDKHHYYGTPALLNRIDRKSGDNCMDNSGFYYNSNDYCCYVLKETGTIKIEKVIEYGFMIISQADSGVRIFNVELGMYVGFIPDQYWFEYDNDTIENVRIELTYNGYFVLNIEYCDGRPNVIAEYSYEGLLLTANTANKFYIPYPLGVTPLSFYRCLSLI